jgi:hypothetical protein
MAAGKAGRAAEGRINAKAASPLDMAGGLFLEEQTMETTKLDPREGEVNEVSSEWKFPSLYKVKPWQTPEADKLLRTSMQQVALAFRVLTERSWRMEPFFCKVEEYPGKVKAAIAATEELLSRLYNLQKYMEELGLAETR